MLLGAACSDVRLRQELQGQAGTGSYARAGRPWAQVRIISEYRTQTSLSEGCNAILRHDCVSLAQVLSCPVEQGRAHRAWTLPPVPASAATTWTEYLWKLPVILSSGPSYGPLWTVPWNPGSLICSLNLYRALSIDIITSVF